MPNKHYTISLGYERVKKKKVRSFNLFTLTTYHIQTKRNCCIKCVFVTSKFWSLVFSVNSGTGRETEHVIRKLFTKFARKRKLKYSHVINWFHTKISNE